MATNTYTALFTTTVGTAVSSVTFSPIPQEYTDLLIVFNGTTSAFANPTYWINNDSGANYSGTTISGNGSTANSTRNANAGYGGLGTYYGGVGAGNQCVMTINVLNYSNTATNKTVLTRLNVAAQYTEATVSLWRGPGAVNSFTINTFNNGGTYQAGSTFTVYGIANADTFTKATGGIISEDSTYTYHVFGSSGTFTPKQALTADILIVAGGGGAGYAYGGGGGAGGLLYGSSQSLGSGTAYTCTVGAGGNNGTNGSRVGVQGSNSSVSGSGFTTLTAIGGGGGGANSSGNQPPTSGGSGGGASGDGGVNISGGAATSGQGFAGGAVTSGNTGGSGGGGAGAVGTSVVGNQTGANGGIGLATYSSWGLATGIGQLSSGTYYLAGGGAGSGGTGGLGGGANPAGSGRANTGGGGGSDAGTGGGGSGVIIIRYPK